MSFPPAWIALLAVILSCEAMALAGEKDDEKEAPPTAEQMLEIEAKSLALLRDIVPDLKKVRPLKEMEMAGGTVRWGNLFSSDEVTALVSLAPAPRQDPYDYPPVHVSYLNWAKGHWEFREYLDSLDQLEVKHRRGTPAHIVQGSKQVGRYDGDQHSWRYSPKSRKLVPTGWDHWGPFYFVGDYICYKRGRERLAHDDSIEIYLFKNGKVGKRLVSWRENDSGPFGVTFNDPKTGQPVDWFFNTRWDDETHCEVAVQREKAAPDEMPRTAKMEMRKDQVANSPYFFELLTGLSGKILDGAWRDEVPKLTPLKRIPLKVTGDPEIVERLQWPKEKSKPLR